MVPPSNSTLWGSNGERARRVKRKPCVSGSQRNSPARGHNLSVQRCVVGVAGGHGESRPTPRGAGGHTIEAEQPPLTGVYWNVAGVRRPMSTHSSNILTLIFGGTSLYYLNFHMRGTSYSSRAFVEQGTWYQPNRGNHAGGQVHLFLMNAYVFGRSLS